MDRDTISRLENFNISTWKTFQDNNNNTIIIFPVEQCNLINENNLTSIFYNNNINVSCHRHAPIFTHSAAVRTIVLSVMAVLSFFANVITIISIHRNRKHRLSSVYRLILHLTIADLFVTFFCIGGDAAWSYTVQWVAGNIACKLFKFMQMFSLYLSTFVLVLIGVDRFVAVRYPMKSLTTKYCNRFVAGAWVLSALCSIPQLVIFRVLQGPFYEEFYQCVTHGFYTEEWQEQLYGALSLLLMFVLPLLILIATYVSTVCTIAQSERLFKAEVESCTGNGTSERRLTPAPDVNRRRLMQRAKMKSLRISVVIVVAFVIWWTPYYVMMVYYLFVRSEPTEPEDDDDGTLRSAIFFFGMSNSLVNPLIYGAFHLWRPRTRASSYRSANFNRDGSTRRSTATHVSLRRCDSTRTSHVVLGRIASTPKTPTTLDPVIEQNGERESTALVSMNCGSVEARLVERSSSVTPEDPATKLLLSPGAKSRLPTIILRYGSSVRNKGGRAMQTKI